MKYLIIAACCLLIYISIFLINYEEQDISMVDKNRQATASNLEEAGIIP
jgi:fucose permease